MKSKVLLMGKSGSGKTSMRSIIFANHLARDTFRVMPTLAVEHSNVRFFGDLVLNLWDCGGQDRFMEDYFSSQRNLIFRNVQVLIFVFGCDSDTDEKDMNYFMDCLDALRTRSKESHVFCLVHKIDLLPDERRESYFQERKLQIEKCAKDFKPRCFKTSIWDESLYEAWSDIVRGLVPELRQLEKRVDDFARLCHADEVVLFERATFLVIASVTIKGFQDQNRFEKISNIIKQFKLSCNNSKAEFESLSVQSRNFMAFLQQFTSTTAILVVMDRRKQHQPAATWQAIETARMYFEESMQSS